MGVYLGSTDLVGGGGGGGELELICSQNLTYKSSCICELSVPADAKYIGALYGCVASTACTKFFVSPIPIQLLCNYKNYRICDIWYCCNCNKFYAKTRGNYCDGFNCALYFK